MISFLKLVRFPQLIILALSQIFLRQFLLKPLIASVGMDLQLSDFYFSLFVISSVLITGAGSVINNYFDLRGDRLNKPDRIVIGKEINRRSAILIHGVLSSIGVILAFIIAWKIHVPILGALQLLIVGLLWFYSTDYKKQFLTGNIVVAILAALALAMVVIFEPALYKLYFSGQKEWVYLILKVLIFYLTGAFLLTLLKALLKDLSDREGDKQQGAQTLAIQWGYHKTRYLLLPLNTLLILLVAYIQKIQISNLAYAPFLYLLIAIQIPLLINFYFLWKLENPRFLKLSGLITTFIMLAGICSLPVFNYLT